MSTTNTERATFCPECGAGVSVDEDGCCVTCGATAVGAAVDALMAEKSKPQMCTCLTPIHVMRDGVCSWCGGVWATEGSQ